MIIKRKVTKTLTHTDSIYEPNVVLLDCGHKAAVWRETEANCEKCLLDAVPSEEELYPVMIAAKRFATVRVGELKGEPEDIVLCRGLAKYVHKHLVNDTDWIRGLPEPQRYGELEQRSERTPLKGLIQEGKCQQKSTVQATT